jgi:hypothetical protein
MTDDTPLPFDLPAVRRRKLTAHPEGHGGVHRRQARDAAPPPALAEHAERLAPRQSLWPRRSHGAENNGSDYLFLASKAMRCFDAIVAKTADNLRFITAKSRQAKGVVARPECSSQPDEGRTGARDRVSRVRRGPRDRPSPGRYRAAVTQLARP